MNRRKVVLTNATETAEAARAGPRSVSRTLDILRCLSSREDGMSLADLAAVLKLPKSSMLNLLKSLEATGYVVSKGGRYVLGSQAFVLATSISKRVRFPSTLAPTLERVVKEVGETALIGAATDSGGYVTYLDVREGERALRLHARSGDVAPINSVVVGHAILAFLPERRRKELLAASKFPQTTPYSLTRAQLEARLKTIREQGYAIGMGGQFEDVMGVAAPVFDHTGEVRCALAVGGPIDRINAREAQVRDCVVESAREMSSILGFQSDGAGP